MAQVMQILPVQCIKRDTGSDDPDACINAIGGLYSNRERWFFSLQAAIEAIESNTHRFYVIVDGKSAYVEVAISAKKNKYLRTIPDNTRRNNLLSLPECP